MCGRITFKTPPKALVEQLGLPHSPDIPPRYNLGPGQRLLCFRQIDGRREAASLKWGLLPRFVADPKKGAKPINARAETVATNGFFKGAFARRRCLLAADGFYEPEENDREEKTGRWWYFKFNDERPFGIASLWESWGEGDACIETFALLTTDAVEVVSNCGHRRSPVIVPRTTTYGSIRRRSRRNSSDCWFPIPQMNSPVIR